MTEINEDGFTKEEIRTALSLLSTLKERAENNGEQDEYADVSQTEYYLLNYEESSEWRKERPHDHVDLTDNATLSDCVESNGTD